MNENQNLAADDAAIRNLCYRFANCVITRDTDAFRRCWTADGVWEIGEPMNVHLEGADNIADGFAHLMASWEFFIQMPHGGVIDINGERAAATWIMNEVGKPAGQSDKGHFNYSTYTDELVKENGEWKFSKRAYKFLYLDETPLAGSVITANSDSGLETGAQENL